MHVLHPASHLVLMPAFVELHAHFRDPGYPAKETLESACLAAVAGGYTTVVCMANTKPIMDNKDDAANLKTRAESLGLIDLYPCLSLTRGMHGTDSSHLKDAPSPSVVRMLSDDGLDVADDKVFLAAMNRAAELDLPVSCHCDFGGEEAREARETVSTPAEISRIEEDRGTARALDLARETDCRVHIAHVSTRVAIGLVRQAKRSPHITCEITPHHLALNEDDARALGILSDGKVAPPLRSDDDRKALREAIVDGTVDAIATDHAPHTKTDKESGNPGFSGLETAFAVCHAELVESGLISLKRLSALMSARPAKILGLTDRGNLQPGMRADLVLVDPTCNWTVDPAALRTRGKNTPFAGRAMKARVLATIRSGRFVYDHLETP
jgi:dihydroorotase